ncbi:MAG: hypothetical protein RLZZ436_3925 [Planctomycetota bacterium]
MTLLLTASAETADQTAEPLLLSLCGSRDHSWQLCSEGEYSCGSSLQDDIRLNISGIDGAHCRLVYRGGQLHVRRGRGRVWVHDLPVATEARIREGDVVSLGGVALRFEGVVTAWIRGGRRIQPNSGAEAVEPATPVVQFVGNSNVPFKRLASLVAPPQQPQHSPENSPAPAPPSKAVEEDLVRRLAAVAETEAGLRQREQHLRESEAAISRILDELEQTRGSQLNTQQQLQIQKNECEEQRGLLRAQETELRARQVQLDQQSAQIASSRQELELLRQQLTKSENSLAALQLKTTAAQQQLADREVRLGAREQELGQLESQLADREIRFAAREQELGQLESQLAAGRQAGDARLVELNSHERRLQARETLLAEQEIVLRTSAAEFETRRECLDSREADLISHTQLLSAREQNLRTRLQELETRENESRRVQQQLADQSVDLQRRASDLARDRERLTRHTHELSLLRQELEAGTRHNESRTAELMQRENDMRREAEQVQQQLLQLNQLRIEIDSRQKNAELREIGIQQRTTEFDNRASDFNRLQERLAEAENGLREREQLIRDMYVRLSAQDVSGDSRPQSPEPSEVAENQPPRDEPVLLSAPPVDDSVETYDASWTVPKTLLTETAGISDETQCRTESDTQSTTPKCTAPSELITSADPQPPTPNSASAPYSEARSYLPPGLLSDDLMDLLEPQFPAGHSTDGLPAPFPVSRPFGTREDAESYRSVQETRDFACTEEVDEDNPSKSPDRQSDAMMHLRDLPENDWKEVDEDSGDQTLSGVAPAEEAARNYVSQLVTSQSSRRSGTAQPGDTPRMNDSLYADRIVHQIRHNKEKPRPPAPRVPVSYIEQFLNGKRKLWESEPETDENTAAAPETVQVHQPTTAVSAEPRQKIDVPRIRREMQSFREVASQAANQAVVSHSLRKSRSALLPRAGLVSIFMVSTVLLARGPLQLGRVYPPVLWCNLALLFLSAIELARKMAQVMWMSFTAPKVIGHESRSQPAPEESEGAAATRETDESPEQPLF